MKKIILICLMAMFVCKLSAQTNEVDSMVNVLNNNKELTSDEKLSLYDKICNQYKRNDLKKLIFYAEKGMELAVKEKDKFKIGHFNKHLGDAYVFKGIYDTSFIHYQKYLDISIELKDEENEALAYGSIGNIYLRQNKRIEALEYYLKALPILEKLNKKTHCAVTLGNIAQIYRGMDNYDRAMYYAEKASVIAEEQKDP
ncbi:MAG: tetratricopeptide repeat protein, partial [Prevotellaceae bacterium]|nr:tetratricopeptide repeat protein [Prevotellaceae bacterium]